MIARRAEQPPGQRGEAAGQGALRGPGTRGGGQGGGPVRGDRLDGVAAPDEGVVLAAPAEGDRHAGTVVSVGSDIGTPRVAPMPAMPSW